MAVHRPSRSETRTRRGELATRLLELAEGQIASAGLSELRARSLADAAGCSVGAIYGVFLDLDELVLLVNSRTLDAIDAAMSVIGRDGSPATRLVRLADAYLNYASTQRPRWTALFQHHMGGERPVSPWYVARQRAAFTYVEAPLAALLPGAAPEDHKRLARSLFAAVHGMVVLGLDSLLEPTTLAELRQQVHVMVRAMARGLAPGLAR